MWFTKAEVVLHTLYHTFSGSKWLNNIWANYSDLNPIHPFIYFEAAPANGFCLSFIISKLICLKISIIFVIVIYPFWNKSNLRKRYDSPITIYCFNCSFVSGVKWGAHISFIVSNRLKDFSQLWYNIEKKTQLKILHGAVFVLLWKITICILL